MKKTISIALILLALSLLFAVPSYAALPEDNAVMPLWDNISMVTSDMTFIGTTGAASGGVVRKTGVELLEGTMSIYQNVNGDWVFVDSAYNSATRGSLGVGLEFTAVPGVEYKAVFNVTAYRNGVGESVEKIVYRTAPATV
jgi:hypothetical protein